MSNVSIYFLGTASAFPTPDRGVSCIGLKYQQASWLFDCGEGSQIQLQKVSLKAGRITKIFITHLHGDHLFGLPGLLCTLGLSCSDDSKHIDIYGPRGLRNFVRTALLLSESCLGYTYSVHELFTASTKKDSLDEKNEYLHQSEEMGQNILPDENGRFKLCKENNMSVFSYEIKHRIPCVGYIVVEDNIPGKLKVAFLRQKGLSPGPQYGLLKQGKSIFLESGEVIHPEDALEPERPGRKLVILGDTCNSDSLIKASLHSDLVVHEATYDNAMYDKAIENGHSTAGMAGTFAQCLKARKLVLTHFSQRYRAVKSDNEKSDEPSVSLLLDEAKREYDGDVVLAEDLMVIDVPLRKD